MSGGILGPMGPQGSGLLGAFDQFANENSASLLGLGAGLLSGGGWGAAAQGFQQGMQADQRTRLLKQKEAEAQQKKVAAQQWAEKNGFDPAMAAADPDGVLNLAQNLELKKRQERAPLEIERQLTAAGITDPAERQAIIRRSLLPEPKLQEFDPDKTYAVRDPNAPSGFRVVNPFGGAQQASGAASSEQAIPPVPPGADPKAWRAEQTKIAAQKGQPTTQQINDLAKAEKSAADLENSLDNYNALVQQYGAEAWNGPAKARMQSAYTDVLIKMKEAANLGVLNGPDLELMQKQLEEAAITGFDRANPLAGLRAFGIEGRVGAQTQQIKKSVRQGLENARRAYGGKQPTAAGAVTGKTQSGITWSAQ